MCFILVSVSHLSGSDKCNLATLKANSKWNNREETIHNSGQLLLQTSVRIQCFMHFLESTWHLSIGNWNECKYTKCLETCFEALTLTHCFTIIIRSQEISVQSHWPRGEGREGSEGMERGGGREGRGGEGFGPDLWAESESWDNGTTLTPPPSAHWAERKTQ